MVCPCIVLIQVVESQTCGCTSKDVKIVNLVNVMSECIMMGYRGDLSGQGRFELRLKDK